MQLLNFKESHCVYGNGLCQCYFLTLVNYQYVTTKSAPIELTTSDECYDKCCALGNDFYYFDEAKQVCYAKQEFSEEFYAENLWSSSPEKY